MAIKVVDRVKEVTNTTGSGTITLGGAFDGFQSFSGTLSDGEKTYYCIQNSTQFEVGRGLYGTGLLLRESILSSSNSNNIISIGSQSEVFIGYPASKSILIDDSDLVVLGDQGLKFSDGTTLNTASQTVVSGIPTRVLFFGGDQYYTGSSNFAYNSGEDFLSVGNITAVSGFIEASGGTYPHIKFTAPSASTPINLNVRATGTGVSALTFDGNDGTLFKIEDNLSTGVIFNISDISGLSLIEADASGDVKLIKGGRYVGIAHDSPAHALDVSGVGNFISGVLSTGLITAATGIELHVRTPATTSNKLYNVGGALYFNGSAVDGDTTYTAGTGLTLVGTTFNTAGTGYFDKVGIGTDDPDYTLDVAGNIGLNEYLYHNGDTNTYIRFRGDQMDFVAGNLTMLTLDEASNDKVIINNGGNNIDFQVEGENDTNLIRTDAANDKVGIGTDSPSYLLDVAGTGNFNAVFSSGVIKAATGVALEPNTPATTTNKLYNVGGILYFNGSGVNSDGGAGGMPVASGALIGQNKADIVTVSGLAVASGNDLTVADDITLGGRIYLESDLGTWIESDGTDRLRFVVGGNQMLLLDEDDDRVNIGYGNKLAVGYGNNTSPIHTLDVDGVARFTDAILASGVSSTGLITAATGIEFHPKTPATTTNKLYNVGGELYFNGSGLASPVPVPTGALIGTNITNIAANTTAVVATGANLSADLATVSGIADAGIPVATGALIGTNATDIDTNTTAIVASGANLSADLATVSGTVKVTAFSNGADNRVITASSAAGINGEANLTFDGSTLESTGLITAHTGVKLEANTPATTTNKIYNVGGVLYFNGSGVNSDSGGGGGGDITSVTAGTGLVGGGTSGGVTLNMSGINTDAIENSAVTVAKMANLASMKALGNVTGGAAAPAAVAILDEDAMGSNSATSLATQQSIKAYADSVFPVASGALVGTNAADIDTNTTAIVASGANLSADIATVSGIADAGIPVATGALIGTNATDIDTNTTAIVATGANLSADLATVSGTVKVTAFTNGADNRVVTASSAAGINGEANLTFDGSTLESTGVITAHTGIKLEANTPATTTNKLYNVGGSLYFNGSGLASPVPVPTGALIGTNATDIDTNTTAIVATGANLSTDLATVSGTVKVTTFTNGTDNRVITASSADGINGEANLTFDGSTLESTGVITAHTGVKLEANTPATTTNKLYNVGGVLYFNGSGVNSDGGGGGTTYTAGTGLTLISDEFNMHGTGELKQLTIDQSTTTAIPLKVQGAASQSANLAEFHDSAGNKMSFVDEKGQIATSGNISASGDLIVEGTLRPNGALIVADSSFNMYAAYSNRGRLDLYSTAGSNTAHIAGKLYGGAGGLSVYTAGNAEFDGTVQFDSEITSTGLITAATGVELHVSTPATTSNKLYNVGGVLYFNGSGVNSDGGGGGAGDITAVVAGTGLSGGATTGSATLNMSGIVNSQINETISVANGGTNATSFADKAVIITQDSSTDTLAAAAMDANGELLIGGTSGPAVATLTAGSSITITNADNSITIASGGAGPSDKKLKKDIKRLKDALKKLEKLEPVEFDWNEEAKEVHDKEGHDIGLIAQDVEKIIPELVSEWKGHKAIDYGKITTLLIDAVKELKDEVQDLKQEINKLKNEE